MSCRGTHKIGEPSTRRRRWTSRSTAKASLVALLAGPGAGLIATPATPSSASRHFSSTRSTITTVTGIRANNMTGNYSIANSGGSTGGLLFGLSTGSLAPFPTATANGSQLPRRHQQHALRAELRLGDRHPARRRQLQDRGFEPRRPRLSLRRRAAPGQQITTLVLPRRVDHQHDRRTATSATRSSATTTPSSRPATPSSTTSPPAPTRPTTGRAPSAPRPTASTATASPAARPTPDQAAFCTATSTTRAPAPSRSTTRPASAPSPRISRASPAAAAPTPSTWSPIPSTPTAMCTPGRSMSMPTAWRPGRKSPCRVPP